MNEGMNVKNRLRTGGMSGAVCAASLLVAGGCGDSRSAWVRNETDTVLRVRFWCGPRETGTDPSTLTPSEVYDVEPGERLVLQLDDEEGFESNAASIVRLQAQPLGVAYGRVVHYWIEINPPGPYGVKALGVQPDIRAERDGTGTMISVPAAFWPVPAASE